jgi:hypothetical protein
MFVLCRPCCAQQTIALFANVGLLLCMVVEVAVGTVLIVINDAGPSKLWLAIRDRAE